MSKKSTKLESIQEMLKENGISTKNIELNTNLIDKIKKNAESVQDCRHASYVKHKLSDIIMIVFFAILANANEWGEIESFAKRKEKWLRKHLDLSNGIPTDDTFRLVIGNINQEQFFDLTIKYLIQSIEEILTISGNRESNYENEILAIDGKESCGSKRKKTSKEAEKALQTLNVYSNNYGMCIGQKFIDKKTNEIPAAQELLTLIDLENAIITADAMNCQKSTVDTIIKGKGDYVLALKGNHPLFYKEVISFFTEEKCKNLKQKENCSHITKEKEHSAIVTREYYISEDIDLYSEKKMWKNLKSFGMVHKTIKKTDGSQTEEKRYYICSIKADAKEFGRAVRAHWGVESMHWQLDFTFRDDKNTSLARTGAKNLQIMKKIVMSILLVVKVCYKISMKRIRYELSLDYENELEKMLSIIDLGSIKKALQ